MLTLLKQARAYGVGLVLATQNPVDLDYKGLGNAGTWFIGRLQTDRDKMRVLEALDSAMAGSNPIPRGDLDRMISGLGKRVFLMHSVHRGAPTLFTTRWAMSYLAGPMTLTQIRALGERSGPVAAPSRRRPSRWRGPQEPRRRHMSAARRPTDPATRDPPVLRSDPNRCPKTKTYRSIGPPSSRRRRCATRRSAWAWMRRGAPGQGAPRGRPDRLYGGPRRSC
jgi:hypothetical protein